MIMPQLTSIVAVLRSMGWRSWEAFYADVDEPKMKATMDVLADSSRGISLAGAAERPTDRRIVFAALCLWPQFSQVSAAFLLLNQAPDSAF